MKVGDDFPVIIYVAKDEVPVTNILATQAEVKAYVSELFLENPNILHGQYGIVFVWNKNGIPMADIWIHTNNEHSNSGPLLENFAIANKDQSVSGDIASGDTIIALAAEEQKRRQFNSVSEYIQSDAPALFPEASKPIEEYPGVKAI